MLDLEKEQRDPMIPHNGFKYSESVLQLFKPGGFSALELQASLEAVAAQNPCGNTFIQAPNLRVDVSLMDGQTQEFRNALAQWQVRVGTAFTAFLIATSGFGGKAAWVLEILEDKYVNDPEFKKSFDALGKSDLLVSTFSLASSVGYAAAIFMADKGIGRPVGIIAIPPSSVRNEIPGRNPGMATRNKDVVDRIINRNYGACYIDAAVAAGRRREDRNLAIAPQDTAAVVAEVEQYLFFDPLNFGSVPSLTRDWDLGQMYETFYSGMPLVPSFASATASAQDAMDELIERPLAPIEAPEGLVIVGPIQSEQWIAGMIQQMAARNINKYAFYAIASPRPKVLGLFMLPPSEALNLTSHL